MKQYRQGDVFIQSGKIRRGLKPVDSVNGRQVLAYGEATGHSHTVSELDGKLFIDAAGKMFLRTDGGCELVHQEHAPIMIPPGDYAVTIQREYTPEAVRNVQD